jgi:hypothetical protein
MSKVFGIKLKAAKIISPPGKGIADPMLEVGRAEVVAMALLDNCVLVEKFTTLKGEPAPSSILTAIPLPNVLACWPVENQIGELVEFGESEEFIARIDPKVLEEAGIHPTGTARMEMPAEDPAPAAVPTAPVVEPETMPDLEPTKYRRKPGPKPKHKG